MDEPRSAARIVDHAGLEVLDVKECEALLRDAEIGRVAFVDAGEPVILPVNMCMWGGSVVFATGSGSKLAAALMGQPVAVEIDGFDRDQHTGWSVVVKGTVDMVTDGREIDSLDRLGVKPWSHPELRRHWVRIRPDEITGRRIVAP